MNKLLIPISDDKFKDKINIKFSNILDGFDSFKNFTLIATDMKNAENKIIEFIDKVFDENLSEAYIDFYINKISDKDKERLISLIPNEDKKTIESILSANNHNGVFYKITNKDIIPFLVRLNTREIFFITFYFTNRPITIWGNYGLKFPCFFNTEENLKFYYNLSKSLGFLN